MTLCCRLKDHNHVCRPSTGCHTSAHFADERFESNISEGARIFTRSVLANPLLQVLSLQLPAQRALQNLSQPTSQSTLAARLAIPLLPHESLA